MRVRWGVAAAIAVLAVVHLTSCPALVLPPRLGLFPGQTVEQATLDAMNPFLLFDGITRRIVLEIAWVEGCEPSARAVEAMERTAREVVPSTIAVEVVRDPAIPRAAWDAVEDHDPEPLARERMRRRSDAERGVKLLYVLSVPDARRGVDRRLAEFRDWRLDSEDEAEFGVEQGIAIYHDRIGSHGFGWVPRDAVEAQVAVHELGHAFGLVGNGDHEASWGAGLQHHCADPGCVMAIPTPGWFVVNGWRMAALRSFPPRFCRACCEDLRRAQSSWASATVRDPRFPEKLALRHDRRRWRAFAEDLEAGRIASAERAVFAALAQDPEWDRPRNFLGDLRRVQGRLGEAVTAYLEALRLDPTSWARQKAATVLVDQGRFDEALRIVGADVIEAARARAFGETGSLCASRAAALDRTGRTPEAIATLRDCLADGPEPAFALSRIYRRQGRWDAAISALGPSEDTYGFGAPARLARARIEIARGRPGDAVPLLRAAADALDARIPAAHGSGLAFLLYNRGACRALLGDAAGAREDLGRLAEAGIARRTTEYYEAKLLALLGDTEAAFDVLDAYVPMGGEDFCDDEDLDRLREDPRFPRRFPQCFETRSRPDFARLHGQAHPPYTLRGPATPPAGTGASMRSVASLVLSVTAVTSAAAAPPPEVPTDAAFGADGQTLAWSATSGATGYDVYRGTSPAAYDQACRVYRTASTSAVLPETPAPGILFYYLVAAANGDGEGILGTDGAGNPVPNGRPCVDADGDLVADNLDNCPSVANPTQADQDLNGVGDACDPNTYDFEADPVGGRPAQMSSFGPAGQTLTVKSVDGEHAISYDQAGVGDSDRFDRVVAGMPRQDVTVYVDWADAAAYASLEFWSDGSWGWNAGNGVILQLADDSTLRFYDRHAQDVPLQQGPSLPPGGRMRVRLVKGPGTTSTLHVDSWDGSAWVPDWATFAATDDHRYLGLGTVVADYYGGPRAIRRITIVPSIPPDALRVRQDPSWSADWKLFQRDVQDRATVPLRVFYRADEDATLQARVVLTSNGSPLAGFDWADHTLAVAPAAGASASLDLPAVPTGGNYDVQARLVRNRDGAIVGQGEIDRIAVGDVYVAGGQSNMSGYSGTLDNAETPVDEVHLFHNDGTWKRAAEPMDDGTDQVDRVSYEMPQHTMLLRFAKEVYQATGVPIGVIPGPLGGTNLYSQWQRNEARHDDRGTLYGSLLHRVLLQGFGTPPKGFLWYQGESDAGRGTAAYVADLKRLMAEYRADLSDPGLLFGIVQLATYDAADLNTWIPIQEAQREVVEADPLAVIAVPIDQPRADVIHLNVQGYKTLGVRMSREFLEHFYGRAIDASARLTKATIVGNNGRRIDLAYDAPVAGGAPSLYQVLDGTNVVPVSAVTASGNVVTLSLGGKANPGSVVTYGFSRSPTAAWVKDAQGTPVAIFQGYPTTP